MENLKKSEIFIFIAFLFFLMAIKTYNELKKLEEELKNNPPIIKLSEENQNYKFPSGTATIRNDFKIALKEEITDTLFSLLNEYKACDAIQIIGHTSGEPVGNSNSNLDKYLLRFLHGEEKTLEASSNTDLGMMRASAVMRVLLENDSLKSRIAYWFPYSAGQSIDTNNKILSKGKIQNDLKLDRRERRRIEIRLFKFEQNKEN